MLNVVILIYILFYLVSILPIFVTIRYRGYSRVDYMENKRLRWERRIMLFLCVIIGFTHIFILCAHKTIISYSSEYKPLVFSAFAFFLFYSFFPLSWLEKPKSYIKQKKSK